MSDSGPRRFVGSAAATAILQIAAMAMGAVLAVLVIRVFGRTPTTDGLFSAYAVYTLLLVFAQTLRTTVVPRLTEDEDMFAALERHAAAALVIWAVTAVPLLLFAGPLAELLTDAPGGAPEQVVTKNALSILWLTAGGQLAAGLCAAALAVHRKFAVTGAAYLIGVVVAAGFLVGFEGTLGPEAMPWGLAIGAFLTAAILLARLLALGYRPGRGALRPERGTLQVAGMMTLGSVSAVIGQAGYAVSLAFAARLGEGSVTFYSYAFFAAMLVMGATAIPAGTVLVAPLSESWQQRTELLERPMIEVVRAGLTLIAPLPALAIVIGPEAVSLALGDAISVADGREIVELTLLLGGVPVATLLGAVPLIAAFSARRFGAIARASLLSMVIHVIASAVAVALDELLLIALATSMGAFTYLISLLRSVYGAEAWSVLRRMVRELGHVTAASAVAFAPALALEATGADPLVSVGAWALGCLALAVILRTRLPEHWELLLRFRYMMRRGPATTG